MRTDRAGARARPVLAVVLASVVVLALVAGCRDDDGEAINPRSDEPVPGAPAAPSATPAPSPAPTASPTVSATARG